MEAKADIIKGQDVFWLVFGLIQAINNKDERILWEECPGCVVRWDLFGSEIWMDFGCPYNILVYNNTWIIEAATHSAGKVWVKDESHDDDGSRCLEDLVLLRLSLPKFRPLGQ